MNAAPLSIAKRGIFSRARVPFTGQHVSSNRPTDAFSNFSEFLGAVVNAGSRGRAHNIDVRLRTFAAAPGVAGSESSGVDGGFIVPPQFATDIFTQIASDQSLLMKCDVRTVKSFGLSLPVDPASPWDASHGITVRWENELADLSAIESKPLFDSLNLRTRKVVGIVPLTDELVGDAHAAAEHVSAKLPDKVNFAVERAIIAGTGAGQPLGIVNSPGSVVVAKESGQSAGTIVTGNIVKMWNALTPSARKRGIWIAHPDADLQLQTLTLSSGSDARAIYQPPTDSAPFGSLLGKPIFISEGCNAVGTPGDIVFADLSQYIVAMKAPKFDTSIHMWFDSDVTAFRFVLRIDGQPASQALIPSLNGSAQRGFFAMLAQR